MKESNKSGHNTMRKDFSFSDNNEIEECVQRLTNVISGELTIK